MITLYLGKRIKNLFFLEDAKTFASQFIKLIDDNMFSSPYSDKDLTDRWQIYLTNVAFDI